MVLLWPVRVSYGHDTTIRARLVIHAITCVAFHSVQNLVSNIVAHHKAHMFGDFATAEVHKRKVCDTGSSGGDDSLVLGEPRQSSRATSKTFRRFRRDKFGNAHLPITVGHEHRAPRLVVEAVPLSEDGVVVWTFLVFVGVAFSDTENVPRNSQADSKCE